MTPSAPSAILEPPAIYGELSVGAKLAYGQWLMALFGLVAHVDDCPFGCQHGRPLCSDGVHAYDDERERWETWRDAREEEPR